MNLIYELHYLFTFEKKLQAENKNADYGTHQISFKIKVECLFIKAPFHGCRSATEILLTVLKIRNNCAFDEQAIRQKAVLMERHFDEKALHQNK